MGSPAPLHDTNDNTNDSSYDSDEEMDFELTAEQLEEIRLDGERWKKEQQEKAQRLEQKLALAKQTGVPEPNWKKPALGVTKSLGSLKIRVEPVFVREFELRMRQESW